jgi:diguanylate cyclase (GGDEF)-like protein
MVNDRFGHLEGNRVLKLVAAGLRHCCREYDYVARMGGDEFVLVLPGLKNQDLSAKLKVLEDLVVSAGVEVCGEEFLNISVGVALCPEHGIDAEVLLAEADRKMYLTKQAAYKTPAAPDADSLLALAASVDRLAAPATVPANALANHVPVTSRR